MARTSRVSNSSPHRRVGSETNGPLPSSLFQFPTLTRTLAHDGATPWVYRASPIWTRSESPSTPDTKYGKRDHARYRRPTDAITADLKAGKSEVVCEQGRLMKVSKDKNGIVTRDVLTKKWTDWVDYWAVDFDYESRREIIKVAKNLGVEKMLPGMADAGEFIEFEERWTGAYIFENEWQSFRTRKNRELELRSARHVYEQAGRYVVAVKVIDIFGNDTTSLMPVSVG